MQQYCATELESAVTDFLDFSVLRFSIIWHLFSS